MRSYVNQVFVVILSLGFVLGCVDGKDGNKETKAKTDDTHYEGLYRAQVAKTNAEIERYNRMLDRAFNGNQLLYQTATLLETLDDKAKECRGSGEKSPCLSQYVVGNDPAIQDGRTRPKSG